MNIAIVAVLLKSFCKPFITQLEEYYDTPEDKLCGVRNAACDEGNQEIIEICDWIKDNKLTTTFFPE